MTQYPEAVLARELELCYANISLITDYDVGVEGVPPVTHEEVVRVFAENNERVRDLLFAVVPALPKRATALRHRPHRRALRGLTMAGHPVRARRVDVSHRRRPAGARRPRAGGRCADRRARGAGGVPAPRAALTGKPKGSQRTDLGRTVTAVTVRGEPLAAVRPCSTCSATAPDVGRGVVRWRRARSDRRVRHRPCAGPPHRGDPARRGASVAGGGGRDRSQRLTIDAGSLRVVDVPTMLVPPHAVVAVDHAAGACSWPIWPRARW